MTAVATYTIGNKTLTGRQLMHATDCAASVACAYAMGDDKNGGGSGMKWEHLDDAARMADDAMAGYMDAISAEACENNGYTPEVAPDHTCSQC